MSPNNRHIQKLVVVIVWWWSISGDNHVWCKHILEMFFDERFRGSQILKKKKRAVLLSDTCTIFMKHRFIKTFVWKWKIISSSFTFCFQFTLNIFILMAVSECFKIHWNCHCECSHFVCLWRAVFHLCYQAVLKLSHLKCNESECGQSCDLGIILCEMLDRSSIFFINCATIGQQS